MEQVAARSHSFGTATCILQTTTRGTNPGSSKTNPTKWVTTLNIGVAKISLETLGAGNIGGGKTGVENTQIKGTNPSTS